MANGQSKMFVLGAGFSAHAGLPLVKNLRKAVLKYISDDKPRFFWGSGLYARFFEGLARADEVLANSGKPIEESFEELLSVLQELKTESTLSSAHTVDRILRCGTRKLLWEATQIQSPPAYTSFAEHVRQSCGVVSFNWDMILECSLEGNGVPWSYAATGPCPVIKPHGSLNWWNRKVLGSTADPGWQPIFKSSTLAWWTFWDEAAEARDISRDPFSDCTNSEVNHMLFPFDPEDGDEGDYAHSGADRRLLWDQACDLLSKSDVVVFLGYSLPLYDHYALRRIKSACIGKKVQIINPSAADAAGLKRKLSIPSDSVEVRFEKFENSEYGR